MHRRPLALLAAAVLAASLGTGCAPAAEPAAFADDEEAFAAAEATYRAYVDADNQRRADPDSDADPLSFLTGHALEAAARSAQRLKTDGVRLDGEITVLSASRTYVAFPQVKIAVCLDVSATRVIDSKGDDITPPERVALLSLDIALAQRADEFLITDSNSGDASC